MTRTLVFPDDAVGTVDVIGSGAQPVPAAGRVELAGEGPVRLVLDRRDEGVLEALSGWDLQSLVLSWRKPRPADLARISLSSTIRQLVLSGRDTYDDGSCLALAGMSTLRSLSIARANGVTDLGLTSLRQLAELQVLKLEQARITDDGVAVMTGWDSLEEVNLRGCRALGAPALEALAGLPRLTYLWLEGIELGDADLAPLRSLESLRLLSVSSPGVTLAALRHLPEQAVRVIGFWGRSAPAAIAAAQLAYPHLDLGGRRETTVPSTLREQALAAGVPLAGAVAPPDAPVMVLFTTDNCLPCERVKPEVVAVAGRLRDRLHAVVVHCPTSPEVASGFGVQSAPTVVVLAGRRATRLSGPLTQEHLEAELRPVVGLATPVRSAHD